MKKNNLNKLELAILKEIIYHNSDKYPFLEKHLANLKVRNREYSGVGLYINFEDSSEVFSSPPNDLTLSSNKILELDNLEYGLNYELNISNGTFDFLELVTNGEEWNGEFKSFSLTEQ